MPVLSHNGRFGDGLRKVHKAHANMSRNDVVVNELIVSIMGRELKDNLVLLEHILQMSDVFGIKRASTVKGA